jgi:hypothetical protein
VTGVPRMVRHASIEAACGVRPTGPVRPHRKLVSIVEFEGHR